MAELLGPGPSQPQGMRTEVAITRALAVLAVLGIVAALYFAKAIFLPLALAILLTFLLAPVVRMLRNWGVPRVAAEVLVVALACALFLGIGGLVGQQVTQLAQKLPLYQFNIQEKIRSVRDAASGGTLERISTFLRNVNQEIRKNDDQGSQGAPAAQPQQTAPLPVEIHQPPPAPPQVIQRMLQPLVDPLTTAGLVVIFVIFFLLQRQDLRDRLIRLAGSHDLQRTTEAINDGARRLSRYFLAQTSLNVLFGIIVGTALTFIGVPNPVLFGILAMVLRFVPYIGAFIAAAFPITLAIAVDPGWTMALLTIALFVIVEPLIGQVIEPLVYGHSTGLTPVAVIIAATFWTWLWGPIGLLLSTPLTVCLGVLGRHIEWLQFVDVMIGDEPPLSPAQSFYQRVLAGGADEALDQLERVLRRRSLSVCYDGIVLPALVLAQVDVRRGVLDAKHVAEINDTVHELIADLSEHEDVTPVPAVRKEKSAGSREEEEHVPPSAPDLPVVRDLRPDWVGRPILCIAGRGPFDGIAAAMLAQLLEKHGLGAGLESDIAVSSSNIVHLKSAGVAMICLSYFELGNSAAHLRHSIRRVRRQVPNAKILAGLWDHERTGATDERLRANAGADAYAFSLRQAVSLCIEAASYGAADADSAAGARAESSAA
jgi:predicted PurR-regulated permease PerM